MLYIFIDHNNVKKSEQKHDMCSDIKMIINDHQKIIQ